MGEEAAIASAGRRSGQGQVGAGRRGNIQYLNWFSDCTFVSLRVRDGYVLLQAQVLDEEDEAEKDWHVLGEEEHKQDG